MATLFPVCFFNFTQVLKGLKPIPYYWPVFAFLFKNHPIKVVHVIAETVECSTLLLFIETTRIKKCYVYRLLFMNKVPDD